MPEMYVLVNVETHNWSTCTNKCLWNAQLQMGAIYITYILSEGLKDRCGKGSRKMEGTRTRGELERREGCCTLELTAMWLPA